MSYDTRSLPAWPDPYLPKDGLLYFYDPATDGEYRVLPEQLLLVTGLGGGQLQPVHTFRFRTQAEAAGHDGGETLDQLDFRTLFTFARVIVEFWRDDTADPASPITYAQELIAVYDPNADNDHKGWRTSGGLAANAGLVGLQLVKLTDPAATGVLKFDPAQAVPKDELRYYDDGQGVQFYQAVQDLPAPVPVPVAGQTTADWQPVEKPPVPGTPVDAYTKAATNALLASKANLDASGVLLASELPTGHAVLRHADSTCQFFSTLAFIRSQMRAGDTLELYGTLDNTGLDLQLPVPLTVYLAAGSDITLDKLRPASSGQTRLTGPGTLRTVLNPGPLATDTLVQDITLVGSIYCYSYGGGVPGKLRLENVRGYSTAGFVAVEYGYSGFYHRYLQVELVGCTIEAGDNLVSFFDQAAGGATDAAAKAGNLLRVERCSLTAPAGKQVLDDSAGAATFQRGGNVYHGLSMPAQLDAQLLTADTDERRHSLAYASSVVLDFVAGSVQTIEPTGPLTLGTAGLALGRQCRLHLFNSSATDVALTFPAGWAWLCAVPTVLAAGKKATLALECAFGATDNDITAGYAAQN